MSGCLGFRLPGGTTAETAAGIQRRLRELALQWSQLSNKSITVAWSRWKSQPTTHED
jgi:hypothetical protein